MTKWMYFSASSNWPELDSTGEEWGVMGGGRKYTHLPTILAAYWGRRALLKTKQNITGNVSV